MKKHKLVSDFVQKMKVLYRGAGRKPRGELSDAFSSVMGYFRNVCDTDIVSIDFVF